MTCGVYIILNKESGERYIGASTNIEKQVSDHFSGLKRGKHCNSKMQKHFCQVGKEGFAHFILQECSEDILPIVEQDLIDSLTPEYNINKKSRKEQNASK